MKTAQLIDFLGANVEPVDRGQLPRTLIIALGVGLSAAAAAIVLAFGIRTDLTQPKPVVFLLLKLVFVLAVLVPASVGLPPVPLTAT